MAQGQVKDKRLLLAMALVLLIVLGGGVAFVMWPAPQAQQRTTDIAAENRAGRTPDPQPLEFNDPEPEPDPQPEPPPKPTVERVPYKLPPITMFRAAVLEADIVLALRDATEPTPEQLWQWASTLDALKSRFAPYAHLELEGKATGADRSHFRLDAGRSFEKPDVSAVAYQVEAAPRVALWLRENAELPPAEAAAPAGVSIPYQRRLQESFDLDDLDKWLAAMEVEYGSGDFGAGGLPLDIVIFPDSENFIDFSRRRLGLEVPVWSAGFFSNRWDVVCVPVNPAASTAEVVRHEMFHALQARRAPQSLLVPWFAEGSAEWLDKTPPTEGLRTLPLFTAAAFGYLRTLVAQGLVLDVREFMALELAPFYQNPELNYLIAYCFVDFCRAEEDLRQIYFAFWNLMCEGAGASNAFDRTFGGLDMAELQRRFMARINGFARVETPPRFNHDAPAEHFGSVPAHIGGRLSQPTREGEVSQGWFEVLGKLQAAGFDTSRASFLQGDFDKLVIAVDSSFSMSQRITKPDFDFDALSRWLFSLRYAGSLQFTRRSEGGSSAEAVPPAVLLSMVEAALTNRVAEFILAANINVSDAVVADIVESYADFNLTAAALREMSRTMICRHTAESVAWYWGTNQQSADVVVLDFNINAEVRTSKGPFRTSGYNMTSSPIAQIFQRPATNILESGTAGADTDWWLGFQQLVEQAKGSSGRVACFFFTDGPNSYGVYGHYETGRDEAAYVADQQRLANELKLAWQSAGLDNEQRESVLQMFALPGAEAQGLDFIPAEVPQARLDEWAAHFIKE